MSNPRGSAWQRWDLHVHTPSSLVHSYGGADAWDNFIAALSKLPPEFKVLGINDYIFLDGYKRVLAAKNEGKLPNIDLLLPVIELRLGKFGGSKSALSRVNYHVIFSDEISTGVIESQFLSALCSKYVLTPAYDDLRASGKWAAVPTRQSIEDLGRLIIESVPASERGKFSAPIIEGFNNLCLNLQAIQEVLKSHYFVDKVLTAVGKTEWANIKWNEQSIADKKSIINGADLVFISSGSVGDWEKAKKSLADAGVNDRLLDCSDAHQFAESSDKDRLGKCFTWIKADPTFEGLRQAVFEYPGRVLISDHPPLEPLLQIKRARFSFPGDTVLSRDGQEDVFCFSGSHDLSFSPYMTCVIGGRGSGKSTLLNLIHEKLEPGSTDFFRVNKLTPTAASVDGCVAIEGISEHRTAEFVQQNEIEQFATDHKRLTAAIFSRLRKLDGQGILQERETVLNTARAAAEKQASQLQSHSELSAKLSDAEKELAAKKAILDSFQSTDYKRISDALGELNKELQSLKTSRGRLEALVQQLETLLIEYAAPEGDSEKSQNQYEQRIGIIVEALEACIKDAAQDPALAIASAREQEIATKVATLRSELESFLKSRGLSRENLSDVGNAAERIAQLAEEIPSLKKRLAAVRSDLDQFTPQRHAATAYAKAVEELLAPVNIWLKGQGTEVKAIEMGYRFDLVAFREAMIQYLCESIGPIEGRAARGDYIEAKMKEIDFGALGPRDETIEKIADDSSVYGKVLREYLKKGENYELLKVEAELMLLDVSKLGQISVLYDEKPVEHSSFGQRCTAVIVILLMLGNTPIVIDEPEAHLDSALIAKYLVDLIKSKKMHRQIIFATHNANFVINGDAELIQCLSMDETRVTKAVGTTIENLAYRERLLALEGGKKAFQQREKRYGID